MTRKLTYLAFALAATISAQAQSQITLNGEIVGMNDSCRVSIVDAEGNQDKVIASTKFNTSAFCLSGQARLPRLITINIAAINPQSGKWVRHASIRTMADETPMTLKITKEMLLKDLRNLNLEAMINVPESGISFQGGLAAKQFAEYLDYTRTSEWAAQTLSYAEADAWFAYNGNDDAIAYMKRATEKAKDEAAQKQDEFVLLHPLYPVSAALVAKKAYQPFSYSADNFEKLFAAIQNNADTMHVNFVKRNIDYMRSHAKGAAYTDFVGKDMNDKDMKLSALMKPGKLTLIDFWASWCGPCRAAIPKIKQMAMKYADKLQVVSCSVDEKKVAWLKAAKDEAMPWPQMMLPLSALSSKGGAGTAYDITTIPRLVVVNAQGKVLVVTHSPDIVERIIAEN